MEIKTKQLKRVDIIELYGRVDSNSAAQLEEAFKAITSEKRFRIVVDMEHLEYISSRGLRALITALKETRRWNRGDVRLCCIPQRIKLDVFDLTGLTPLFKIYSSSVEAVGSF